MHKRYLVLLMAVIGPLFIQVPLAQGQRGPAKRPSKPADAGPPPQTLQIDQGISLSYPADWSYGQPTMNSWVLLNVPMDQLATATPTIRVQITYAVRVDHNDALNQLNEFANEYPNVPVTYVTIGGWPGLQRVQTIKKPQPGDDEDADQMVIEVTTAVAADNLLVRLEGQLPPIADQATQNVVLGIGQTLAFQSSAPGIQVQQELKKLKRTHPSKPRATVWQILAGRFFGFKTGASGRGDSIAHSYSVNSGATKAGAEAVRPNGVDSASLSAGISRPMAGGGAPVFSLTNLGLGNGELEVAVSNDGKNIMIGRQSVFVTSNDGGLTFPFSGSLPVSDGDSSLAFGQSGNFYHAALACFGSSCAAPCPASSNCVEIAKSTNNGQSFGGLINAVVCPNSGGGACSSDQEHIGADRFNAGSGGNDRVYMAFRDLSGSANITCSPDSGATWSPRLALEGGSDYPRVTVGQDGFFYVVFHNGGNIRIDKFNACTTSASQMTRASASFPQTVSSYNDVAGCEVANGFPGLDRCNDGNKLSSWMAAVDDTNANHVYVSWATNTAANNENVLVADSNDGGKTWRSPVTINTGVTARRFMPWVCPSGGNAFVTWYGRDAATVTDNSLTDFFAASAGLSSGNLVANNDQFKISAASDSQCRLWPNAPRSTNDSENCSIQPQLAGTCSITTSQRCDFSSGGCPMGETCQTGGGGPKYGDYNGNACVLGRLYTTFATGKLANGTNNSSVTDFFRSFVVSSTPTTLTYTGPVTGVYHDPVTLSAVLSLSGTSSGISGQNVVFTLGAQGCSAPTNASGFASCTFTLNQTPGPYIVTASFAGSGNFQASSTSSPFTITKAPTTLTYNGDTIVGNGNPATMSAILKETDTGTVISGRTVSFALGTGGSTQTCSGTTNGSGVASCIIVVNQPFGPQPIAVNFAGDAFYLASMTTASLFVPEPPQVTKSFADSQIELFFGFTRLSYTVTNPNPIPLATVSFSDTLPSGLIVLAPDNGEMGTCFGGTISAVPASSLISLTGANMPSNGVCTFSVLVNAVSLGVQNNVTSSITSTTGGGLTGSPATASISVVFTQFIGFFGESGGGAH